MKLVFVFVKFVNRSIWGKYLLRYRNSITPVLDDYLPRSQVYVCRFLRIYYVLNSWRSLRCRFLFLIFHLTHRCRFGRNTPFVDLIMSTTCICRCFSQSKFNMPSMLSRILPISIPNPSPS